MTTVYWLTSSNFSSPDTQPLVSKPLSHFLWILPALSLSISPTLYKSEWIRLSPVLTVSVVSSVFAASSQFSWMLLYVWFSGMCVEVEFWRVEPNWLSYWLDACPCHSQRATQAMAVRPYFILSHCVAKWCMCNDSNHISEEIFMKYTNYMSTVP